MNKPIRLHSELIEAPGPLEAIEIYFNKGWSDGLPVVPPTPESVSAILETANLSPEAILGIEPVKGAVITAFHDGGRDNDYCQWSHHQRT